MSNHAIEPDENIEWKDLSDDQKTALEQQHHKRVSNNLRDADAKREFEAQREEARLKLVAEGDSTAGDDPESATERPNVQQPLETTEIPFEEELALQEREFQSQAPVQDDAVSSGADEATGTSNETPSPVRGHTNRMTKVAAFSGPLLALVAIGMAWQGQQATEQLRSDVNTALVEIDDVIAGQQNTNTQLMTRIDEVAGDISDIFSTIAGLGIDAIKQSADELRADLVVLEEEMTAATQTQQQVTELSTEVVDLHANMADLDNRLKVLSTARRKTEANTTKTNRPVEPTTVSSLEGAEFVQIDVWGRSENLVMVDERGNYFTLAVGDRLSDFVLRDISKYSATFERGDERVKIIQRGM